MPWLLLEKITEADGCWCSALTLPKWAPWKCCQRSCDVLSLSVKVLNKYTVCQNFGQYVHMFSSMTDQWRAGQEFAVQQWLVSEVLQPAQQCLREDHSKRVMMQ